MAAKAPTTLDGGFHGGCCCLEVSMRRGDEPGMWSASSSRRRARIARALISAPWRKGPRGASAPGRHVDDDGGDEGALGSLHRGFVQGRARGKRDMVRLRWRDP